MSQPEFVSVLCPADGCARKVAEIAWPTKGFRIRCKRCGAMVLVSWIERDRIDRSVEEDSANALARCIPDA